MAALSSATRNLTIMNFHGDVVGSAARNLTLEEVTGIAINILQAEKSILLFSENEGKNVFFNANAIQGEDGLRFLSHEPSFSPLYPGTRILYKVKISMPINFKDILF